MKLLGWLSRKKSDDALQAWRAAWAAAVDGPADSDAELRRQLDALSATEPDVEIELEMLEALEALRSVQAAIRNGGPPVIETGHRVVGAESCHFSAPASVPTDQVQAAGRVLLTRTRAVFVGGGRTAAIAWHQVHEVARLQRDVLFVRPDKTPVAHYRFNSFVDAVVCAFLAAHLKPARHARL